MLDNTQTVCKDIQERVCRFVLDLVRLREQLLEQGKFDRILRQQKYNNEKCAIVLCKQQAIFLLCTQQLTLENPQSSLSPLRLNAPRERERDSVLLGGGRKWSRANSLREWGLTSLWGLPDSRAVLVVAMIFSADSTVWPENSDWRTNINEIVSRTWETSWMISHDLQESQRWACWWREGRRHTQQGNLLVHWCGYRFRSTTHSSSHPLHRHCPTQSGLPCGNSGMQSPRLVRWNGINSTTGVLHVYYAYSQQRYIVLLVLLLPGLW